MMVLFKLVLTVGLTLILTTPALAQASNLLTPRRQDEYQGPAAEPSSAAINMMEFMNNAAFKANSRSASEFLEDSQDSISRAAEAFRAKQRQLLSTPETTVEVKPRTSP
ncbi:MAG: hypothetical protein Q6K81_05285 [Gloeomargarita sp. DG02_5_bins_242]